MQSKFREDIFVAAARMEVECMIKDILERGIYHYLFLILNKFQL